MKVIFLTLLLFLADTLDEVRQGSLQEQKLKDLCDRSSNIARFTQKNLYDFAVRHPRPYTLVILFVSTRRESQLHSKLLSSYIDIASSFQSSKLKSSQKVYFSVIEYTKESEVLFKSLGFTQFPHLLITKPGSFVLNDDLYTYPKEDLLKISSLSEASTFFLLRFLNLRLSENVQLNESLIENLLFFGFVFLALSGFFLFVFKLKDFFLQPIIWYVFSICIFFLCTSGIVYDILREPAILGRNEQGNTIFINPKPRMQFLVEGFMMSSVLCLAGLCLVGLHVVRNVEDQVKMRIYASLLIFCCYNCLVSVKRVYRIKSSWYNPAFNPPEWYIRGPLSFDQGLFIHQSLENDENFIEDWI
jgi:hypothetical protein